MTTIAPAVAPRQELPADLLRAYREQFVNRPTTYCTYDAVTGRTERQHAPCTDAVIRAYLQGEQCIALDERSRRQTAKWICIAADAPDGLAQVQQIRAYLPRLGITGHVEACAGEPILWFLLNEPLDAYALWFFADALVTWVGRDGGGFTPDDFAIIPQYHSRYPSIHYMTSPPCAVDPDEGTIAPFVDAQGRPCHGPTVRESVTWLLDQPRLTCMDIGTALRLLHAYDGQPDEDYDAEIALLYASSPSFTRS